MKTVSVKYKGTANISTQSFENKTYSFTRNISRDIPIEFYNELSESLPGSFEIVKSVTEIKIEDKPIEEKKQIKKFAISLGKKEDK